MVYISYLDFLNFKNAKARFNKNYLTFKMYNDDSKIL